MKLSPFITAKEIENLNKELGERISKDYKTLLKPDEELVIIVTLKGAMLFAADLIRHITVPVVLDFVRLTSYGAGTQSSGTVRILKDIETNPENKHLIMLDEIIDSGRTFQFYGERLKAQNPKSLKLCALLSKPSRREVEVDIDYLGREVEDKFLVGYGLDFNEQYRNLKEIYAVEN